MSISRYRRRHAGNMLQRRSESRYFLDESSIARRRATRTEGATLRSIWNIALFWLSWYFAIYLPKAYRRKQVYRMLSLSYNHFVDGSGVLISFTIEILSSKRGGLSPAVLAKSTENFAAKRPAFTRNMARLARKMSKMFYYRRLEARSLFHFKRGRASGKYNLYARRDVAINMTIVSPLTTFMKAKE